jgi:hypothetical protein
MEAAIAWLVAAICRDAERWGWAKAKEVLVGSPLERALSRATSTAMSTAVAATLGAAASPAATERMEAVLNERWPVVTPFESDPALLRSAGLETTLLERLESIVATATKLASSPVLDLGSDDETTSSLASLGFEIGVHIDEAAFVGTFMAAWVSTVRAAALTDAALAPLVNQLEHETTRQRIDSVQAEVGRQIAHAVQVLSERMAGSPGLPGSTTERWFEFHIVPIDNTMLAIFEDYSNGFNEAANSLDSRESLEAMIPRLHQLRRSGLSSRINAKAMARALDRTAVDEHLAGPVIAFATGVRQFLNGADPEAMQTWYSYYIERFSKLLRDGFDPLDPSLYGAAELPPDVAGSLRSAIQTVVHTELPRQFEQYKTAFHELQLACVPSSTDVA